VDQSPGPMTLPARTEARRGPSGKESRKRVVLSVAPRPFPVLVALVGRRNHDGVHAVAAGGVENVSGSHHVRGECLDRGLVGRPHEGLGGEVKHNVRPGFGHYCTDTGGVVHVGCSAGDEVVEPQERGMGRC
jgi:hypothetical protein